MSLKKAMNMMWIWYEQMQIGMENSSYIQTQQIFWLSFKQTKPTQIASNSILRSSTQTLSFSEPVMKAVSLPSFLMKPRLFVSSSSPTSTAPVSWRSVQPLRNVEHLPLPASQSGVIEPSIWCSVMKNTAVRSFSSRRSATTLLWESGLPIPARKSPTKWLRVIRQS